MIQKRFQFRGTVQGVGFRYTACRVANGYNIAGYVKNLPDGSVECVVEGRPEEIEGFLDQLQQSMSGHIRQTTEQEAPASGRWDSFGVSY